MLKGSSTQAESTKKQREIELLEVSI